MTVSKYLPAIRQYKEDRGCSDCRNRYPHYMLEFDHRPEHKKLANVYAVLKKYGNEKAWEEIDKCDVVCANCHKHRTHHRKEEENS